MRLAVSRLSSTIQVNNKMVVSEHSKRARKIKNQQVETCPSYRNSHLPCEEDVEKLRDLAAPHVDSFNYFLETGLPQGIKDIEPSELAIVDPKKMRVSDTEKIDWDDVNTIQFWIEDVKVGCPTKPATSGKSTRLLPRECRERGLMYAGPMTGTFCYNIIERRNGVSFPQKTIRFPSRSFGNMPIMAMSRGCHLHGMPPKELASLREEVC